MEIPTASLLGIVSGLIGAGVAWGGLIVRSKNNAARIEEVKVDLDQEISEVRTLVSNLAESQAEHRVETTDRLARIEEKLDRALSKE